MNKVIQLKITFHGKLVEIKSVYNLSKFIVIAQYNIIIRIN